MRLQIELLVRAIDEAFDTKSWHGTNLRGSLRGLRPQQTLWRPAQGRHNIWEIVVHAAYWKYIVHRRLTGGKRGRFPLRGSDWFDRKADAPDSDWPRDIRLLDEMHGKMRAVVVALKDGDLSRYTDKGETTVETLMRGVAAHDLYHAGQIQLLKRLYRTR
ncbi:MAG: DinB family protein [Acidobacteriota bacterium]